MNYLLVRCLCIVLFWAGHGLIESANANTSSEDLVARLAAALPKSWVIAERKPGVLPQGHYWGQDYHGARGEEILLQGPIDIYVAWQDSGGEWHKESVGKEALKLYLMPTTYSESLLRFFIPKRPLTACLLSETPSFKVYAWPSFTVIEREKLDRVVKHGKAIRWPDSPEVSGTLSWSSWRSDIKNVIHGR